MSALAIGCTTAGERAVQDSAAMVAGGGDTAPRRLASDATLTLVNAPPLAMPLRIAADSFGRREAVSVRQETVDSADLGELGATPDIIALDADVFPRALIPTRTSWYVQFAADRMVLAYRDSSRAAATIDSTNWPRVLQRRTVRVGRVDAAAEPAGYRTLLAMKLAEAHYEQPGLAAKLLRASPRLRPSEASLVAALDSMALDYIWTHESTARDASLRYLRLPHEIDLGEPADSAIYAAAEVAVPIGAPADTLQGARGTAAQDTTRRPADGTRRDTMRIRGAPILYGVSIPNDAPNPRHADRFLRYLFSDDGRRVLEAAHLSVLAQPIVVGTDVPPTLRVALGAAATPMPPASDTAVVADTSTARGPEATGRTRDTGGTAGRKPPR